MPFAAIDDEQLKCVCGGIRMRLTQFGYRNDPYMDSETRKGHGAYRHLKRDTSIALTDSALRAFGLTKWQVRHHEHWVEIRLKGGGRLPRRIDDRAPERNKRADLYMVQGFSRRLPDYADVRLIA